MRWSFEPRFGPDGRFQRLSGVTGPPSCATAGFRLASSAGMPDPARALLSPGEFVSRPGEQSLLVMTAVEDEPLPLPERHAVERRLSDTVEVWQSWTGRHTHEGPWTDAVERSLLAIRLLTDGRTGAIAAAGTTSLPEVIGGNRNYDYRFAWVRDASFSLDALLAVGMEELTHTSVTWLLESVSRTHPRVDPVYALDGWSSVRKARSRSPDTGKPHPSIGEPGG